MPGRRPVRPIRWRKLDTVVGVDLDDPVQVAHVDAQLQNARGHDHAVVPVGEGLLGLPTLLLAERAVGDEGRDAQLPQPGPQFLGPGTAVDEDQPLLAPVQPRDHHGRVLQRADVVQLDLGLSSLLPPVALRYPAAPGTSRPASRSAPPGSPRWPTARSAEAPGRPAG